MALAAGSRLGPYEVVAPLGAGGMGEVYRARDPRLDRTVAIKALPESFAGDADRLARFDREARLLAALSHPNIGAIFGLEEKDGVPYLVLEFVEGETLAQRLGRGALPLREALEIAMQIAAGIEAAHERGIVHRDLKPGNVMITAARIAKVLDFGLAKGTATDGNASGDSAGPHTPAPHLSATPTVAMSATGAGIILGTAPYMSPEQARGRPVDRRADVWAFGCILYECLAGRQAFAGETVSDVIARILEREPEWAALPASVPPRLRDLTRRCLTKEASERPRDIGDLRRELIAIAQELSAPPSGIVSAAATPSLAVLYFENLSTDKESEYFCAGITEDILTDLSKIKGLRVASRNAVLRYRGAAVDIAKISAELGVRAVLEGSVRRAGDRVRITAQLINAADGFQLWAERYDRTLQDVFAVQEEIASSIAQALRVAMTPAEAAKIGADRPSDARAYDLYLKGRAAYNRRGVEAFREALALFEQAIAIDADYALAWAGIADTHAQLVNFQAARNRDEALRLGLEAANRAVSLNPRLAEGWKSMALVKSTAGDHAGAEALYRKAIEVDPRHVPAIVNLGVGAYCSADFAGAERFFRRALDLDPQHTFSLAWLLFLMGQVGRQDEVVRGSARLRALSGDTFSLTVAHELRVWVHLDRGDPVAAMQAVRDALADAADPDAMRCHEALIAARAGRTDEARRLLDSVQKMHERSILALVFAAATAIRLGDLDRANRLMATTTIEDLGPVLVRMTHELHPLADVAPFAPRRWDRTLVWPLEAPMIDAARFALFKEVKIESGLPAASEIAARG